MTQIARGAGDQAGQSARGPGAGEGCPEMGRPAASRSAGASNVEKRPCRVPHLVTSLLFSLLPADNRALRRMLRDAEGSRKRAWLALWECPQMGRDDAAAREFTQRKPDKQTPFRVYHGAATLLPIRAIAPSKSQPPANRCCSRPLDPVPQRIRSDSRQIRRRMPCSSSA